MRAGRDVMYLTVGDGQSIYLTPRLQFESVTSFHFNFRGTERSVRRPPREARVRTLAELMDRLPASERDQLGRAAELIEHLLRRA